MAMQEMRLGALAVIQNVSDKDWISRRLKQLSPRLFVERQMTLDDEWVWCVVEDCGVDQPPVTVYEFRDSYGAPIPYLTEAIVHEMERRAKEGRKSMAEIAQEVIRRNEDRRKRNSDTFRQNSEDQLRDTQRLLKKKHSIPGIRGAKLRSTREKMRERGEKC